MPSSAAAARTSDVRHLQSLPSFCVMFFFFFFFFNDPAPTEIYPLSLHDALPISQAARPIAVFRGNFHSKDDSRGWAGREFSGCTEPPGPYNSPIISDNRPVPAFPQGDAGLLEQKLEFLMFGLSCRSILVTRSPVTQLQAGECAIGRGKALPVQFIYHCNTRLLDLGFLYHLQCNTSI